MSPSSRTSPSAGRASATRPKRKSGVRRVVQVKDSFTKMQMERDWEMRDRLRVQVSLAEAKRMKRAHREELRRRLSGLMSMTHPHRRGIALEGVLNDIFDLDGLSVRESSTIRGPYGIDNTAHPVVVGLASKTSEPTHSMDRPWEFSGKVVRMGCHQ